MLCGGPTCCSGAAGLAPLTGATYEGSRRKLITRPHNTSSRRSRAVRVSSLRLEPSVLDRRKRERQVLAHTSAAETVASKGQQALSPAVVAVLVGIIFVALAIKRIFDTPSRKYDPDNPNVGESYDAWEQEGILEYYWGEHIHLGYYSEHERRQGYKKKDFKQAKFDFIDEMLRFSGASAPQRILDVGCGIGGTSRYLARKFPDAEVHGITLSPQQVRRAGELAHEHGLTNARFSVMNALDMGFGDGQFDLVWACESGEHMPDKAKYVEEMARVLAPGGQLVIATWCQREETPEAPFTDKDRADLQFLYDEWTHPHFISKEGYSRIMQSTGVLDGVHAEDWTPQTLPTWRHSNWVGVWDPWIVVRKGPRVWYGVLREIVTIERMHRAFSRGLMEYGMARAVKRRSGGAEGGAAQAGAERAPAAAL